MGNRSKEKKDMADNAWVKSSIEITDRNQKDIKDMIESLKTLASNMKAQSENIKVDQVCTELDNSYTAYLNEMSNLENENFSTRYYKKEHVSESDVVEYICVNKVTHSEEEDSPSLFVSSFETTFFDDIVFIKPVEISFEKFASRMNEDGFSYCRIDKNQYTTALFQVMLDIWKFLDSGK